MSLYRYNTITSKKYNTPLKDLIGYGFDNRVSGLKFGLEIEMENTGGVEPHEDFNMLWTHHVDNSLRNNGIEYVTRGAGVNKEIAFKSLDELEKLLNKYPKIEFSERTSFHVHMNFQDRTLKDFHNFLTTYYMLENLLTLRAGFENRVANLFCLRLVDANAVKKSLLNSFAFSFSEMFGHEKYLALNLSAFGRFGTLEVRVHRGTKDVHEYKAFIEALEEIYTNSMKFESPMEIFQGMSSLGFVEFFNKTFPATMRYLRNDPQKLINTSYILSEINQAMVFCQGLATIAKIEDKVEEAPKKKLNSTKSVSIRDMWGEPASVSWSTGIRARDVIRNQQDGFSATAEVI